jgi:hypothetical protein
MEIGFNGGRVSSPFDFQCCRTNLVRYSRELPLNVVFCTAQTPARLAGVIDY